MCQAKGFGRFAVTSGSRRDRHRRDYYAVLGVPETATHDEIICAYRRLARTSHPDVDIDNPQATEEFERLVAAREVLGDPANRAAYDELRASRARSAPRIAKKVDARFEPARRHWPEPAIRPGPVVWTPDTPRWTQP
jgi:curved DNA-binding protein CbpA